ncbi:MAG TPA: YciI family protein [Pyrinomonadaceae bacterium]|nr:YciI family protein [Pyrinomonadaceae bacterium]
MKYMLLIYHDEQTWNQLTEAERQQIYLEYRELRQQLQSSGQYLMGNQLQPTTAASTVRVRDRKQLVTDGPFAETREQLGGFFMIEATDPDEATRIAAQIPSARMGSIEIRPVVETAESASA